MRITVEVEKRLVSDNNFALITTHKYYLLGFILVYKKSWCDGVIPN
jgi:hypothetical protein